tara:strand:- start:2788 stop:3036 length:249 start_codon:yes stop_codon:yes gene_type:complete
MLRKLTLRALQMRWFCRAWIVSAGLVVTLLIVSGCWGGSGVGSDFCLIYQPMPSGSLGSVEISREALRVIGDNEIAFYELCD